MSEDFFSMRNVHVSGCGQPPRFSNKSPAIYHGYFENSHSEQWVFSFDTVSGKSSLRGGDAGWENAFDVVNGVAAGLVLSNEEKLWLVACWAATGQK